MRILVVGGGAREHAICVALRQGEGRGQAPSALFCAPGNPGIAEVAGLVPVAAEDVPGLVAVARDRGIDLVVPGPEAPLVAGLADALGMAGIACCGPSAAAARLEGSKSFAKEICDAASVPTALWERFTDAATARAFVRRRGAPIVVKADGLAAGKGVVVAGSVAEAEAAIVDFLERRRLGAAGEAVVIEDVLAGTEASLFALCDGREAVVLGAARDYKRVGDGDTGPNTGGMGAISPPSALTAAQEHAAMERIVRPTLAEMARRGTPFRGVLFAGLMLGEDGPKLIEFNVRLGDPEAQALLPRLDCDLAPLLLLACDGGLAGQDVAWRTEASVAVVLAARGYPGEVAQGAPIGALEAARALPGVSVFQAATRRGADGGLEAAGGRVLTVQALAPTLAEARAAAYRGVDAIPFPGGFCRRDIGA